MGCKQSYSSFVKVTFSLPKDYFIHTDFIQELRPSTQIRSLVQELKKFHLKDDISPNKLEIKFLYKKYIYPSNSRKTLEEISYSEKSSLRVICRELQEEQINIRFQCCEIPMNTVNMIVKTGTTIGELKEQLRRREVCKAGKFHLVWQSLDLEDDRHLEDYEIENDDTVKVIINLRSVSVGTKDAPSCWKLKNLGLVLEGICMNDRCVAYKQRVSTVLGFGEFDITAECNNPKQYCSMCCSQFRKIQNFGFVNCSIKCRAVMQNGIIQVFRENKFNYEEYPREEFKNCIQFNAKVSEKKYSRSKMSRYTKSLSSTITQDVSFDMDRMHSQNVSFCD